MFILVLYINHASCQHGWCFLQLFLEWMTRAVRITPMCIFKWPYDTRILIRTLLWKLLLEIGNPYDNKLQFVVLEIIENVLLIFWFQGVKTTRYINTVQQRAVCVLSTRRHQAQPVSVPILQSS